jgi:hypothetical protein
MKTAFMTITHTKPAIRHWEWTRLSAPQFRRHFPDAIWVVVDRNHIPAERLFLERHNAILLNDPKAQNHGTGMDVGLEWCKQNGIDAMIHWEPDCIISGTDWATNLTQSLERGASMAGTFKWIFGPIHPCPSIWRVDQVNYTFDYYKKGQDFTHPMYDEVFDTVALCKWMFEHKYTQGTFHYFLYGWDVGIKNWFDMAIQGKTEHVSGNGIDHFWDGHTTKPTFNLPKHFL